MHVTHLSLADFRSYESAELPLEPGVTALVGPNGQGKTNLVEAIGYVASHSSHRVSTDFPLIRAGAARAVVRTAIQRDDRKAMVELEIAAKGSNRARINRSPVTRPRDALGMLRTVLFAPEDLAIVKGEPDGRRRFMDDLLVLRAPRFAGVRSDYDKVLRQRNALLKTAGKARRAGRKPDLSTLDVWNTHLAGVGAELLYGRLYLVRALTPLVAGAYEAVSRGQGNATLTYRSTLGEDIGGPVSDTPVQMDVPGRETLRERLLAAMEEQRSSELERGVSLVGPHRDDLLLSLGGLPAKGYASHGESWSFALALRLASYDLLRGDGDESAEPVLILDDVFAELDAGRRERLAEMVAGAEQVLVTAAVAEDVPKALSGGRVDVVKGAVSRVY
ncbi:DNA replication/repair protein RecF [Kineosporia rhizophila]|uniref:DNA replication/repair protein RecF n=1 Tax=Kineosporia TaxID=49184 RepID=UPI001E43B08F|nr:MULTISPECIES: DNA replication/repair protein RecF [Kineosporia]MCE0536861.1 DNA replication/repair protein RecF [Kineosporia rhizophila]GLY20183.1 DNA replication and repair protein RecF [Kineosporia sp. NBRC 101677]